MPGQFQRLCHHHHHQPINVPTAGAQAFLMDYLQGEPAITHHAGPVRIVGARDCKYSRDQLVNVPSEARRSSIL
jgi:hypothetical protein